MTIDWSALSQIDAPRCVDWEVCKWEVIDYRMDAYAKMKNSEQSDADRKFNKSTGVDSDDIASFPLDFLDALFDEAAGYA